MSKPMPLARRMRIALLCLRDEARLNCGWRRKGVRGWRMYREIKDAVGRPLMEDLPYLAKRGLLDRLDVLEPGRQRPMQLYRISEAGARLVAECQGEEYRRLPRPTAKDDSEGVFYIPVKPWSVLRTLRIYAAERVGPVREGAHGWMTLAELRRADTSVERDNMLWLLTRKLVERREVPNPDRPARRLILYRATEQGQRTEPVESIYSPRGVQYVAVRVRREEEPIRDKSSA